MLAACGVERGLLGPREIPRLWDRHVLDCAALAPAFPAGATSADVESGAGLPGLVLAICRPDLRWTLVEPLLRRTEFLTEAVDQLGLRNVEVLRARAQEVDRRYDAVTARAVAPLARLAEWCLPMCRASGELLAIKGRNAAQELEEAAPRLQALGAVRWRTEFFGDERFAQPTTVVRIESSGRTSRRRKGR